MFKSILIATDGSIVSDEALSQAIDLAQSMGAKLTVVTITPPMPVVAPFEVTIGLSKEKHEEGAKVTAEKILKAAVEVAAAKSVTAETVHVANKEAADGVLEAAAQTGADLVVVGSHSRRGLKRVVLGSQASKIASRAKIPVMVCPADASTAD